MTLKLDQSPDILAIRPGDRVTASIRHGQLRSGKAVMPTRDGGWVVFVKQSPGRPLLVYPGNLVAIRHHGKKAN